MKKIISIILTALLLTVFTACGSGSSAETAGKQTEAADKQTETAAVSAETETPKETAESTAAEEPAAVESSAETKEAPEAETGSSEAEEAPEAETGSSEAEAAPEAHSDVLVAYFSATGTTKGVAERIASVTGGDLYEILAAQPYSADDLNYNDRSSRSTKEQNDKSVRPEIGSADISLDGYTTIYLGFPIWWGEEPRILDTFVEKYSFDGITVIPFCTSGGSGIGRSGPNMEALAGSGTWLDGKRFSGSVSEEELLSWTESLNG